MGNELTRVDALDLVKRFIVGSWIFGGVGFAVRAISMLPTSVRIPADSE